MDNIKLYWTGDAELTSEASQRIVEDSPNKPLWFLKTAKPCCNGGEVASFRISLLRCVHNSSHEQG